MRVNNIIKKYFKNQYKKNYIDKKINNAKRNKNDEIIHNSHSINLF